MSASIRLPRDCIRHGVSSAEPIGVFGSAPIRRTRGLCRDSRQPEVTDCNLTGTERHSSGLLVSWEQSLLR
jgi:hypothetical protein